MAATVRIFSFSGVITAPKSSGSTQLALDSIGLLKYPYAARETISATTGGALSTSADLTPEGVELILVQVQQGKSINIELNPPNRSVAADTNSPVITGDQLFKVGKNWLISVLEHTVV